ncbi:MAG: FAD-binding protein [Gemmataceae bacterium]
MSLVEEFPEITKRNEPLAPYTHLKIGGPAELFIQPRTVDELRRVLTACQSKNVPVRMLGGGHNLLVRDDPVPGAVVQLRSGLHHAGVGRQAHHGRRRRALCSTSSRSPCGKDSPDSKRLWGFAALWAAAFDVTSAIVRARSGRGYGK